jgi:hypothetical protein
VPLDLCQPLCRITDCADRADELANDAVRLAARLSALARDLRWQSVAADQHLCALGDLLGATEEQER